MNNNSQDSYNFELVIDEDTLARLMDSISKYNNKANSNPLAKLWNNPKLLKLVNHNGADQRMYCIEECSELTKELVKEFRGKSNKSAIIDEAIDVLITTCGILHRYGATDEYVDKMIQYKLDRGVSQTFKPAGKIDADEYYKAAKKVVCQQVLHTELPNQVNSINSNPNITTTTTCNNTASVDTIIENKNPLEDSIYYLSKFLYEFFHDDDEEDTEE